MSKYRQGMRSHTKCDYRDGKFELRATIDSDVAGALISISAKYEREEPRDKKFLELTSFGFGTVFGIFFV